METISESAFVFLVTLTTVACTVGVETGYLATKADGEEAVRLFRQRLSEERYEDIYGATDESFRASAPKAAILAQMRQSYEMNGVLVTSEPKGSFCQLQEVELWYHSHYEHADLTEMFRWHMRGTAAELVAYRASQGMVEPNPELQSRCP